MMNVTGVTNDSLTNALTINDALRCYFDFTKAELPVLLVCTIIVNILAFIVLQRMRKLCENIDHLLVCILNLNDLLTTGVCVVSWILGWSSCGKLLLDSNICLICGWLTSSMVVWSAFILVIVSSCRYLSLVKPFYYRINVTRRRVITASLGSLAFSLLVFIFPMTGWGQPFFFYYENHICAANFAPGGSTVAHRAFVGFLGVMGATTVFEVLFCNFFMIKTLRSRSTVNVHNKTDLSRTTSNNLTSTGVSGNQGRRQKRIIFERASLVISMVYVFCYSPFAIRLLVDTAQDRDHQNYTYHSITMAMMFMSPILNPIIYGIFNRQFRRTLIDLFRCKKMQAQGSVSQYINTTK